MSTEPNSNTSILSTVHNTHHRKNVADIIERQTILAEIISDQKAEHNPTTPKELLPKMKKRGYNIDRSTLYRDRLAINQRNSFVRDLSESNYSSYIQDMFENIDYVTDEAMQMLTTTGNDKTKILSGKLILEGVRTKTEILSGKVLDISVELLSKKMRSMREENNNLQQELAESRHDSHSS